MTIRKKGINARGSRCVLVETIIRFIDLLRVAINWPLKKDRKNVVYLSPILRLSESRRKHVIHDQIKPSEMRFNIVKIPSIHLLRPRSFSGQMNFVKLFHILANIFIFKI